jgi:PIN domain nuclease of toxin-antitoxin system
VACAVRLVLDTHALIWAFQESPRLGHDARRLLAATSPAYCACSDVSLSEVARLIVDRRVTLAPGMTGDVYLSALAAHAAVVPVTPRIAWRAASLTWTQKDPCDRHIVATALEFELPLLTGDGAIARAASGFGLEVIW